MKHPQQQLGSMSGRAAEWMSRLNFVHRNLMRFWLYRQCLSLFNSSRVIIGIPYLWLFCFFIIPFLIILRISFTEAEIASPPYTEVLNWVDDGILEIKLNFQNYIALWQDNIYISAYLSSIKIAVISTFCTFLIGFPIALGLSRLPKKWRLFGLMMVILPFWTSFLIRIYAWMTILSPSGVLNNFINFIGQGIGLIDPASPVQLQLLGTEFAVYVGIVYCYLPFMILPIYATLDKMDHTLVEAALDLGCPPLKTFWVITARISLPGILAGCFLVFIPAMGEFVIPDLLGGSDVLMIGKVLYDTYLQGMDLPLVSAISVSLLLLVILPIYLFQRIQQKQFE
ncbi:ABC transporter permease subunit [Wohlfahrtiimonas chitiniclastica]|uniref:ABC transporter permease subunit n=1 Tax=Wohlfahrtiimonas chitiniclastica TaxID=400946 RepID=UPI001BCAD5C4|nr:ABC transporter permease subunit [Wohlfahrtiimonas chitiniclastica]MBS7828895.1 ABC transporter permease subunit [Wohlfahrtiimonas chitiniclastica]